MAWAVFRVPGLDGANRYSYQTRLFVPADDLLIFELIAPLMSLCDMDCEPVRKNPDQSLKSAAHRAVSETLEDRRMLAAPYVDSIANLTIPLGNALQLPLTGKDADGDRLTYRVAGGGAVATYLRPATNTWIDLETANYGTMRFSLFDDSTPETIRRMKGLIASGFYDGLTFHRIVSQISAFRIIQGGDPSGDGTGINEFTFEDEFKKDLTFSGSGQLAMANRGQRDTNGSQFFITGGPTRSLDYNHTIWGQLVRGRSTLSTLLSVPVDADGPNDIAGDFDDDHPVTPVVIDRVRLVENKTDAVVQLRATKLGSRTVSVKATDSDGNSYTRTFKVTVVEDSGDFSNQPPILNPLPDNVICVPNSSVTINLSAHDPEGDAYTFDELLRAPLNGATLSFNQAARTVTYTPAPGFTGSYSMIIGVREAGSLSRGAYSWSMNIAESYASIFDAQKITIAVGDSAASGSSRTVAALSGQTLANVVVASFIDSDSSGVSADWTARIDWGDGRVTDGAVVMAASNRFDVLGAHKYSKTGPLPITVDLYGNKGSHTRIFSDVEVRPMLTLNNSVLQINGSDNAENISLTLKSGYLRVNINGDVYKYRPELVSSVRADLFGGNDTLVGNSGTPSIWIDGGEGNDLLRGGSGHDTIFGQAGRDVIEGRDGNDQLDGGADNDIVSSGAGRNTLYGGDGDDRLNGSGGRELIYGQNGNDRIYGRGGDDTLDGGGGVDRAYGEDGNDLLIGGGSNDKLYGGPGADILYGNAGNDLLRGDEGENKIYQD